MTVEGSLIVCVFDRAVVGFSLGPMSSSALVLGQICSTRLMFPFVEQVSIQSESGGYSCNVCATIEPMGISCHASDDYSSQDSSWVRLLMTFVSQLLLPVL